MRKTLVILALIFALGAVLTYASHWGWVGAENPRYVHNPSLVYGPSHWVPHRPSGCTPTRGERRNSTLYVSTRQLYISGSGIDAVLTVDLVSRNATSIYGVVVYGTGTVKLGNNTYVAKSVSGVVAPKFVMVRIYTGRELIFITYHNGRYKAVVKLLGAPGAQIYSGTASLS